MRFSTLIRFLAALLVLSALAGTLMIAKRALFKGDSAEAPTNKLESLIPVTEATEEAIATLLAKLEVENLPDVTPGERAFESARELLVKGDYLAAEEKLKYVNTYYPTAVSAPEARRILGEMNMDRLFAGEDFSEVSKYKVKRGDSFFKIVKEGKTNLDLLMFLNDMKRTDRLHPGEVFDVMPLNYKLVVDTQREVLSIWDGPRYIKGYEMKRSTIPKATNTRETSIVAIEAQHAGKRVRLPSTDYRQSDKVIVLKSPQAEIRAYSEEMEEGIVGVFLDPSDIEELALLVRPGNSLEIRY